MGGGANGRFPWGWLAAGLVILAGLTVWGVVAYPDLPDRVPQHMGSGGVDEWADKTVGSVFLPVFVYAGTLAVMAATTVLTLRVRPTSELAPGEQVSSLINRPSTPAGALLLARAQMLLACGVGAGLAGACTAMWSTTPQKDADSPWTLPLTLAPIALGTFAVLGAALKDKSTGRKTT
ncbi:DUF1648 domain-containing protein [Streptomyces iconiensis]|uniref:DUF1648 domain-containing protein n=1 Tax=Streptomyces iconiensis TaxID=1384038 RepID=A0ABT6ZXH3_9ACTN|nr:DUF1648 domain-containing protein [Streptomyces iconiensis]MDJ1133108.1 DUF1648 domain-containing protein [Streptomyces iconiensis]